MTILEINALGAFYGKAQALHDVSLKVEVGEIIAIVGANGAGKSTLLDSIMGLTTVTGEIRMDKESLINAGPVGAVKRGVGYAPERFNLFPHLSVRDNLLVGAHLARADVERNLEVVHRLFPRLAERADQETATQSGGERQMVSLGRALMTSPRLLLVDEPTIGLAPKVCQEIANSLIRMRDDLGLTVVITEQNANFAMNVAERVYVMETGRIVAEGTARSLAQNSKLASAYFGQ